MRCAIRLAGAGGVRSAGGLEAQRTGHVRGALEAPLEAGVEQPRVAHRRIGLRLAICLNAYSGRYLRAHSHKLN